MFPQHVQLQQIQSLPHAEIVSLVNMFQLLVMMALLIPLEQLPFVQIVLVRHILPPLPIMAKQLQLVLTIVLYALLANPKQLVQQQRIGVVAMNVLLANT